MLTSTSTRVSKLTEYTRPLTQESEISRNVKAGVELEREREGWGSDASVQCKHWGGLQMLLWAIVYNEEQWKTRGEKDPIKSKINDMANLKEVPTKRRVNDNMVGAQKILKEPQQGRKMDP